MAREKVGVLTFHKCINYGSYWQARCLVEGLRIRGYDAEILDHDSPAVRHAEAKCALQPELPARTRKTDLRKYAAKTRKFITAIADLPQSRRFPLNAPEMSRPYDAIIVGSDEVWNFRHPWYGSKPIFFGDGLKAQRFISYAASFGNHSACDGIDPAWAGKLHRFDSISVRDSNSWHLVKGGTGREAAVVLDPVLQFPEVTRAKPPGWDSRYALIYGHGFPEWLRRAARTWSERRGIALLSIGYANDWADQKRIDLSPLEFPAIVAGARAVITNFFHGCVFALLHGKPWVAAPSDYRAIKIPDLAAALGAEHRIIDEGTRGVSDLLDTPILPTVASRLDEYRQSSKAYLDAALA